jgi:hypothetical protein
METIIVMFYVRVNVTFNPSLPCGYMVLLIIFTMYMYAKSKYKYTDMHPTRRKNGKYFKVISHFGFYDFLFYG